MCWDCHSNLDLMTTHPNMIGKNLMENPTLAVHNTVHGYPMGIFIWSKIPRKGI